MQPIEKSPSKTSVDPTLSKIAAFENYFLVSGRKYRHIQPVNVQGQSGYSVETRQEKQSIPLMILKAASLITLIVPLIMGIGLFIVRKKHHFISNQSLNGQLNDQAQLKTDNLSKSVLQNSSTSGSNPQPTQVNSKILPPNAEQHRETEEKLQKFKTQAQQTLQAKNKQSTLVLNLSDAQKELLSKASKMYPKNITEPGIKMAQGGVNKVIFLESVEGVVFKPMESQEAAENYLKVVQNARETVANHNLHLLHVPDCKIIEIQGEYFIAQEKASLIADSYEGQRGVYTYCWNQPELSDYIQEIFSELLIFISKTHFSDVKYDNIALDQEGKVVLFDLDQSSAVLGLTEGRPAVSTHDGLFNYIPKDFLEEFLKKAKLHLDSSQYTELETKMDKIKDNAELKIKKQQEYTQYLKNNAIISSTQRLNEDLEKMFDDEKNQQFCAVVVKKINDSLSESFSLKEGRTVKLNTGASSDLYKEAQNIWGKSLRYITYDAQMNFKKLLNEVLEGLKTNGYVHKYKDLSPTRDQFKIVC